MPGIRIVPQGRVRWLAAAGLVAMLVAVILGAWWAGRDAAEAQVQGPGAPPAATISLTVFPPGPVTVGESEVAGATIGGAFGAPTSGTVRFFLCGPAVVVAGEGCLSGAGLEVGVAQPVTPSGIHFSVGVAPNGVGVHCFGVFLEGSGVYLNTYYTDFTGACVTVVKASPDLVTASTPTGEVTAESVAASDLVTLSGPVLTPAGTVRFFLCGPFDVTPGVGCVAPAGVAVGAAVALVAGEAASAIADVAQAGQYCWRVEYAGDAAHDAASHTNATSECFRLTVPAPGDTIDVTLDAAADAQRDGDGVFFEASAPDGSVRIRVRDLPPGVAQFQLSFTPLRGSALTVVVDALSSADQALVETGTGVAAAGEVLLVDATNGAKLTATVEVILAPLAVAEVQFLLWLVEGADGSLKPAEFRVALDGTLTARFPFDLIFIILDMPAPQNNLRAGLNAVVYTGPRMPADRAFPGGPGRGAGIEALWRFTGFGFQAFFPAAPQLGSPTYRLYDPLFVIAGSGGALMQQGLLAPVRRSLSLSSGDNLVSYTGSGGSILNVVDAAVVARTRAIWIWRDAVGAWLGFFPGAPVAVQGISSLLLGDLVFIHSTGVVGWDMR